MLGNWSFGDYFKAEAIAWAWELLTVRFGLDPERLYATYFGGDEKLGLAADEEARALWLRHLPESRVLPCGAKDNFWEMGDQGPCGPCSELHYDRIGGRQVPELVNADDPDLLEIWNLVFIQYNREADGSLRPLPNRHIDTGAGFERLVSVLQDRRSNYDTDVFAPIFEAIQRATGCEQPYRDRVGVADDDGKDMAYRVVADHIRTLCFAIADGARPGNEGRDYVLRRVLRRAVRYGRDVLGGGEGFFASLADVVVDSFGAHYPELVAHRESIREILRDEESAFSRTLVKGLERFRRAAAKAKAAGETQLPAEEAFRLWDTFGFPIDLTTLMAEEAGLEVDQNGFEAAMEAARDKARAAGRKGGDEGLKFEAEATGFLAAANVPHTDDSFKYLGEPVEDATVLAVLTKEDGFLPAGQALSLAQAEAGPVGLVLDRTPFYAESGGQVADEGEIVISGDVVLRVEQVVTAAGYVLHVGRVAGIPDAADATPGASGALAAGSRAAASIDRARRSRIAPNHTFTHVLNFGLREVLGDHVNQRGSIVAPDRLRFDFSHPKQVSPEDLAAVEKICVSQLEADLPVYAKELGLVAARDIAGLHAVFGEAYPDPVRVVSIGKPVDELAADPENPANAGYSVEFCGGTHLASTGQAEAFALLSEEGIAKGTRRIVAVTGREAKDALAAAAELEARAAALEAKKLDQSNGPVDAALIAAVQAELKGISTDLDASAVPAARKHALRERLQALARAALEAQKAAAKESAKACAETALKAAAAAESSGARYALVRAPPGSDLKAMTEAWNQVKKAHPTVGMLLTAETDGKALAYAAVPDDLAKTLSAKDWLAAALKAAGGRGGGKPTAAQGTAPDVDKLSDAEEAAAMLAQTKLQ